MKAFAGVTAAVVIIIVVGALVAGPLTTADARTQMVESAVAQAEQQYYAVPGSSGAPTVSYVVTSPRRAYDYLMRISWSTAFYSTLDCHCVPTSTQPVGESGTPVVELNLIPDEHGPVALVELTGVRLSSNPNYDSSGGGFCIPPCRRQPIVPTVFEAPTAFLVVNLGDGKTTGGMIATPMNRASSFPLGNLGSVTSWTGPNDMTPLAKGYKLVLVDTPHQTHQ